MRGLNRGEASRGALQPHFAGNRTRQRHRWYYYKEGFDADLVRWFISAHAFKGRILDPFAGSGTVLVEAARNGWESVGIEVNPFAAFLSQCKIVDCEASALRLAAARVMQAGQTRKWHIPRDTTLVEQEGLSKWLFDSGPVTAFESIRGRIEETVGGQPVSNLLVLAAIGGMTDVANARRDGKCWRYRPTWRHLRRTGADFLERFRTRVEIIASDLALESNLLPRPSIFCGDSRTQVAALDGYFDAALTSPPYLNSFDYTDVYRPELLLMGAGRSSSDLRAIRFQTIRSHVQVEWEAPNILCDEDIRDIVGRIRRQSGGWNGRIADMINAYFVDLLAVGQAVRGRLKSGACFALVVADSAYCGLVIRVPELLTKLLCGAGFEHVTTSVLRKGRGSAHHQRSNGAPLREVLLIVRAQ